MYAFAFYVLKSITVQSLCVTWALQYFCTQYWEKRQKDILIKAYFFLQNIVVTFYNIFKLGFSKHNCPKINIFNSHKKKNIGWKISFYLFIAIYFYLNIVYKNIVSELGLRPTSHETFLHTILVQKSIFSEWKKSNMTKARIHFINLKVRTYFNWNVLYVKSWLKMIKMWNLGPAFFH